VTWFSLQTVSRILFSRFPQTPPVSGPNHFSTLGCLNTPRGHKPHSPPNTSPGHTHESMHPYAYDGCDSDSPVSDLLSGSDSEASGAETLRSVVIILDDSDEDEVEEQVHPLPSHRPKKPLPRNFSGSYRSSLKEESTQGIVKAPYPEVYHTISCAPAVRDKSLEELRVECYTQSQIATREPPKPVGGGMRGIPPTFFPWRDTEGDSIASVGQVEQSVEDVSMDD